MGNVDAGDLSFLNGPEQDLVLQALGVVNEGKPDELPSLLASLEILRSSADIVQKSPPILRPTFAEGRPSFSGEALIDLLCRVPDYDLDLHIPTKAVLGQAYLVAKINFFKSLGYALEGLPRVDALLRDLEFETGQVIYSKLGEELFIAILTDPAMERSVKAGAARLLFRIWDCRLETEIADFAPLLDDAWNARNKVRPVMGTMLGTHEVFELFRNARDESFLNHFGHDDVSEEELLAFEEFVFGLSHEEIRDVRTKMVLTGADVVSPDEVPKVLGRGRASWVPGKEGAQSLYTSFKKRRLKAHYRVVTSSPGPKKTAEEYVMIALIRRGGLI